MCPGEIVTIGSVKSIWDMLLALLRANADDKRKFFEKHVEPLHLKLVEVHKDYVASFQEVQKHLKDKSRPTHNVIAFLKERKQSYGHEHKTVIDLAAEIGRPDNQRFRGDVKGAICAYCTAVANYFWATQFISYPSWYEYFIETVEKHLRHDEPINIWTAAIAGNPRESLLGDVDEVLDRFLPESFGRVSERYAAIKILLT